METQAFAEAKVDADALEQELDSTMRGERLAPMHCGSIENPIRVMRMEHSNEGERYMYIQRLTHDYAIPEDACPSFGLLMTDLKRFMNRLFEHIHLENNIIFPAFVEIEKECVEG